MLVSYCWGTNSSLGYSHTVRSCSMLRVRFLKLHWVFYIHLQHPGSQCCSLESERCDTEMLKDQGCIPLWMILFADRYWKVFSSFLLLPPCRLCLHLIHCCICSARTSRSICTVFFSPALCVFNMMTLFLREALMRSGRSGSFTSPAGRTTACPTTPRVCWGSSAESSPRRWPTPGPWWFTAGVWCEETELFVSAAVVPDSLFFFVRLLCSF